MLRSYEITFFSSFVIARRGLWGSGLVAGPDLYWGECVYCVV